MAECQVTHLAASSEGAVVAAGAMEVPECEPCSALHAPSRSLILVFADTTDRTFHPAAAEVPRLASLLAHNARPWRLGALSGCRIGGAVVADVKDADRAVNRRESPYRVWAAMEVTPRLTGVRYPAGVTRAGRRASGRERVAHEVQRLPLATPGATRRFGRPLAYLHHVCHIPILACGNTCPLTTRGTTRPPRHGG